MILVPYPFPLRPDLTVTLELPDDLTDEETGRLQRYIGTLTIDKVNHDGEADAWEGCICTRFSDTEGFRIADLCCPVHGVGGSDPGDGYWDA